MVANTSNVHLAPGMAYLDFGFIEPGLLAAQRTKERKKERGQVFHYRTIMKDLTPTFFFDPDFSLVTPTFVLAAP